MTGRLTLDAARRIALAAQGVGRQRPVSVTMRHVQAEIDRVAQFQIDAVNVSVRAHYMPLFTRLGSYDPELLRRASESQPRRLFEYWGHAACLIDAELYPAFRWRMQRNMTRIRPKTVAAMADNPGLVDALLAQIDAHGPLTARDMENDETRRRAGWWNWSRAKLVLEHLFEAGTLSVAGRTTTFERRYDRIDRVLGPAQIELDERESHDALVRRSARALGVADLEALTAYFYLRKDAVREAIARLEASGELERVTVSGLAATHWLWHQARHPRTWHAQALVSPFDSLAFERGRLENLFGTRYRIEIYVPAAQRVHGYYVYLFFLGDAPAARVDLKADRAGGVLLVRSAWLEPQADADTTARALAAELHLMAGWLGLGDVTAQPVGTLAAKLSAHL